MDKIVGKSISMCDVINMSNESDTSTTELIRLIEQSVVKDCNTQLELETLKQGITLELIYVVGFSLIGLLINRVGKFVILSFLLGVGGAGGILCMLTDNSTVQIYSFLALMSCGLAENVVSAAVVEIFPTSSRAMAICIALMFGRLGGVAGSTLAASLLNDQCETAFYLSGSSLIACIVLAFFIPNIHRRTSSKTPSSSWSL